MQLAARAVADGVLLIIPERRGAEALCLFEIFNALLGGAELEVGRDVFFRVRIVLAVCNIVQPQEVLNAADDGGDLRARELLVGPICTVGVAADDAVFVQRVDVVVVGVGKIVCVIRAAQPERVCSDLCDHTARHGHVQIGDVAAVQDRLRQREVQIAARPV